MRRAGPILILVIGVLALLIDFFPSLRLPDASAADAGTGDCSRPSSASTSRAACASSTRRCRSRARRRRRGDMDVIKDIIERRVNTTGVSEPVVSTQGTDRVVVELPGVPTRTPIRQPRRPDRPARLRPARHDPGDRGPGRSTSKQYPPLFSGDQVASATVGTDQNGRPAVDFVLKADGARTCSPTTPPTHVGEYFAIALDGKVISAPVIQNSIPNGKVQITGGGIGGFTGQGRHEPRHGPQVRLAAVPDRGAVERADQRDARRAVPRPEPARRAHRDRAGHRLHAHLLPAAGRRRELRAHLLHARRATPSSGSSR